MVLRFLRSLVVFFVSFVTFVSFVFFVVRGPSLLQQRQSKQTEDDAHETHKRDGFAEQRRTDR